MGSLGVSDYGKAMGTNHDASREIAQYRTCSKTLKERDHDNSGNQENQNVYQVLRIVQLLPHFLMFLAKAALLTLEYPVNPGQNNKFNLSAKALPTM